ncbi:hypothetical protein Mal15_68740 [Stieleria maiorica]|uniref:Uncharacterized protein n=1 Tax=Stieleria maiorica TaxID=2795974 RepID=A0A5B9MN60_9BACT|nr:hypothetical protein Mal15_68740 [Stieleria maiorica]
MDTCNHPPLIQTNHGVCFPLVGPKRVDQVELLEAVDSEELTTQRHDDDTVETEAESVAVAEG